MEQSSTLALSQPHLVARRLNRWSSSARAIGTETRFELRVLGFLTILSLGGTLAAPMLYQRPLLLMALSPRFVFVAIAAGHSPLPLFVAVGLVRLTVADPLNYALGRVLGSRVATSRFFRRLPDSKPLAALLVLLRPSGIVMAYAGSIGLRGRIVSVLDVISTTAYLLAVHVGVQSAFG